MRLHVLDTVDHLMTDAVVACDRSAGVATTPPSAYLFDILTCKPANMYCVYLCCRNSIFTNRVLTCNVVALYTSDNGDDAPGL